jgi:hypothetical protein
MCLQKEMEVREEKEEDFNQQFGLFYGVSGHQF